MGADQKRRWPNWLVLPLVTVLIVVVIPIVVVLIPIVLLWLLGAFLAKLIVLAGVWICWLPRGKDTLIVYSRSPHWMEYFESGVIPRLERRAVVLNWSDRAQWPSFALSTMVFQAFKGGASFNPMVLVFRPLRWPERFRFYDSFKQRKHGKEQPLRDLEAKLATYLTQA